jgi:hypothetical protein
MLNLSLYAECHYAKCHYAESNYTECRGAVYVDSYNYCQSSVALLVVVVLSVVAPIIVDSV